MSTPPGDATFTRLAVLEAANSIVANSGPEALTLPSLCSKAHVQPLVLAKLFGTRDGIVQAAAEFRLRIYKEGWGALQPSGDPLEDFRVAWHYHTDFLARNPPLSASTVGVWRHTSMQIDQIGLEIVSGRLSSIGRAMLLRISEERALLLVRVALTGTTASFETQMQVPLSQRNVSFICESLLLMLTSTRIKPGIDKIMSAASTLSDNSSAFARLSAGESLLLRELLLKIANQ